MPFQKGHIPYVDQLAEKNSQWKGDKVKSRGLHRWIRRHLPEPDLCQVCHKRPPNELANINKEYNRYFHNWLYLCFSCHRKWDH